jgi:hypothetical protein
MNTAVKVKENAGTKGQQFVYRLNPPMRVETPDWESDNEDAVLVKHYEYVVVSRANVPYSGWETYIFPANEHGEITDWGELPGSQRGDVSHEDVLYQIDYLVCENEDE